jgi:predicted RNase H-like nuclease (RuvC/YqgF family)
LTGRWRGGELAGSGRRRILTRSVHSLRKRAAASSRRLAHARFALQVEFNDGKCDPPEVAKLVPGMKVYVNAERKALKVQKSYEELQREVDELRKTVEQLKKKLEQLERDRKPD